MQKEKLSPKMLCLCALFTALLALGAYLRIPLPIIPVSMQTLFVILSGLLMKRPYAIITCLAYLFLGLTGLPVFTQGGGIGYILHPTFGYLIGFVFGVWVMGKLLPASSYPMLLLAALGGLAVIYLFGAVYYYLLATLYLGQNLAIGTLLTTCVLTTLPSDCIWAILAAYLAKRLKRHM